MIKPTRPQEEIISINIELISESQAKAKATIKALEAERRVDWEKLFIPVGPTNGRRYWPHQED